MQKSEIYLKLRSAHAIMQEQQTKLGRNRKLGKISKRPLPPDSHYRPCYQPVYKLSQKISNIKSTTLRDAGQTKETMKMKNKFIQKSKT